MSTQRSNSLAGLAWPLVLAVVLLLGAWVFSTFPFQGPDEDSHFLRALSITNGLVLGPKIPYTMQAPITVRQRRWSSANTRAVDVPPKLSPLGYPCATTDQPDTTPQGCIEESYTGNYPPLPYLLPAAALAVSTSPSGALWFGRLASALPCVLLIGLAFMFAARGGLWPLLGLAVAASPMTFFVSSVINPNGLQIAASLAFAAGLLRIVRQPETVSDAEAASIAGTGAVVVLAWQLGPLFAVCDLALATALLDRGRASRLWAQRELVLGVSAVLGLALVLYVVYAVISGSFHGGLALDHVQGNLTAGFRQLPRLVRESVGSFAANDVQIPRLLYLAWLAIGLTTGFAATLVSTRRMRVAAIATPVLALLIPVLFFAFVYSRTGWPLQGRYVLPLIALPPLAWGELLGRARRAAAGGPATRRGTLACCGMAVAARPWPFAAAGLAVTAVLQCWAWWTNARVGASPSHAFWFLSNPAWSPPLGWPVWTGAALAGGLVLIAVAGLAARLDVG